MKLTVLLVPSRAAATEIPRRLTADGHALAGLLPMTLADLVDALADPALLGRGLRRWDSGLGALLATRVLDEVPGGLLRGDMPRPPVARVLARTFAELRGAGAGAAALEPLAAQAESVEDEQRLRWIARLYHAFGDEVEGRFADAATRLRAATEALPRCAWLSGAAVLIASDLELRPLEEAFVAELARVLPVRHLARAAPPALVPASFAAWAARHAIESVAPSATLLAPVFGGGRPELEELRRRLFEPPAGAPLARDAVELITAPGEAAEVRSVVRRILREAGRGVPFEDMGVVVPQPEEYARLFTDLLTRLGIPHRLHPSLPLRFGRIARSLLLLLRCRGLRRGDVMEFLTFAPVPFNERLGDIAGEGASGVPISQWDVLSREAGVVSGLDRWAAGMSTFAESEDKGAAREPDPERRERRVRRASDARRLLHIVTQLDATLAELSGRETWEEWAARLTRAFDRWIAPSFHEAAEREAVRGVLQELAGLGFAERSARWEDVEGILESRFEWERQPVEPQVEGGVHVGAIDALAGLPFRWLAIVGLVEGGFPGVLRPDPLLLDPERLRLRTPAPTHSPDAKRKGQLSLLDDESEALATPAPATTIRLATTQDRLLEMRRAFVGAVGQALEKLVLSYPRSDPRSGRERLPSLFFMAAATALTGSSVGAQALAEIVAEDEPSQLPAEDALDASERDRARVGLGGKEAVQAIAAGSRFFKQSHLAAHARWSKSFTPYDGLVAGAPVTPEIAARLDPTTSPIPVSASGLGTFATCGFKYLLQQVLRLDPGVEPEERTRLNPLERGSLFHEVAENFLRERRDQDRLPVRNTLEERVRLRELAEESLELFVAGAPPRFTVLWERERRRFHSSLLTWIEREAQHPDSVPLHFEVGFGLRLPSLTGEPHLTEPLVVDLGEERTLRVAGRIDRIDRRADGALVVRDYKTGRTPTEPGVFRGGRQLQMSFYVLAVRRLFPNERVAQAFLDYVDDGRRIAFEPDAVTGESFLHALRVVLSAIAAGNFVQEPASCEWCDFKRVCGPAPLIDLRRRFKIGDRRVQSYLRLRDLA